MQNPIQTMLQFQIFQVFFSKNYFFYCFDPYTAQVRKLKSVKNHFLVLFYSAKSISDHFTISEFFQVLQKINFLHCFEPYTAKVKNMRSEKKVIFSALLLVQNPIQTMLRFQIFQVFFSKN